jgi:hypothetical protein
MKVARRAASMGISITTIGLGHGYNEELMTAIAQVCSKLWFLERNREREIVCACVGM